MEIKEQWRKLRECHREALRRQYNKRRRSHGMYTAKMWMYQKQMEFLLPFMAQRGPDTTLFHESPEEEYSHQFKMEDSSEDQPSTSETIVMDSPASHQSLNPRSRYKRKVRQEDQETITVPEPVYELQNQRSEDLDGRSRMIADAAMSNDSLYHFFICMFNTTKNLPMPLQLRVKKRIFDVVVEAEEEIMETSMELGVHHLV
ncbi:uncharacterized protein [Halyomorpha halys]